MMPDLGSLAAKFEINFVQKLSVKLARCEVAKAIWI